MPETTPPKRVPGRPRKNPDGPMSPAERQAARRVRQHGEVQALRQTITEQRREMGALRDTRMMIRNILGSEDATEAGEALKLMRWQLIASIELVGRVEQAMGAIKTEMYHFAVGGKAMDKETRKMVFHEIVAIQDAAQVARKALTEGPSSPPAWARGEMDWA